VIEITIKLSLYMESMVNTIIEGHTKVEERNSEKMLECVFHTKWGTHLPKTIVVTKKMVMTWKVTTMSIIH